MHILVINFTADATPEQFDALAHEDAPIFAGIEGLAHEYFIDNHQEKIYGGINMFENKRALDAYLSGDIYKSVMENPHWSNYLVRHYEVQDEASNIQNKLKKI